MTSNLFNYDDLAVNLTGRLQSVATKLSQNIAIDTKHGDFASWYAALQALPELTAKSFELQQVLQIGEAGDINAEQKALLREKLFALHPWRKGPIELFGVDINTEWRSDWKWDRVLPHLSSLKNRNVLDVGCGNGYYCWRMAGEGARLVLGVDSHLLFTMQYWAIRKYLPQPPVWVLPWALEDLPEDLQSFDTVFSMGVLYHRRSPFDHLLSLRSALRPGGQLVLETLVIEGETGKTLVPHGRYARMPNVWFLPSSDTLSQWLIKTGFKEPRLVDLNRTSPEEQRTTDWMTFESLSQALDPENPLETIEGYPAPLRAVFIAERPGG
jgi:tRNA (mo5U34)-methyltransferase